MTRLITRLLGGVVRDGLGRRGERLAARWLRRRGYRILGRNTRLGRDEADLVALDPDGRTIVVVEVKTRRSDEPPPEVALDRRKLAAMGRVAARVQARAGAVEAPVRVDAIAVVWPADTTPTVRHHVGVLDDA